MNKPPARAAQLELMAISLRAQHEDLIFGSKAIFWMALPYPIDLDPVVPDWDDDSEDAE